MRAFNTQVIAAAVVVILTVVLAPAARGEIQIEPSVQTKFVAAGGSPKALAHLNCIIKNFQERNIAIKKLDPADPFVERCNKVPDVRLNSLNTVVLVDYTQLSSKRRLWMIPTNRNSNSKIARLFVSHGRFGTSHDNATPGPNRNTVAAATYFSNTPNSNASATGFYVTGEKYLGENTGPNAKDPKHSLYLHGVEPGVNDNSCARAIVIHGSSYVRERGTRSGVKRMSSGCFMVDYAFIENLLSVIKSPNEHSSTALGADGGAVLFAFGQRELNLPEDYYCNL